MSSQVQQLISNLRSNEAIAKKLFHIETAILACQSSKELLYCLLDLIKDKFNLSEVYLVLAQPTPIPHLFTVSQSHFLGHSQVYNTAYDCLQNKLNGDEPKLTNQLLELSDVLPEEVLNSIKSAALIPLHMETKLFGALVLGDKSPQRFYDGLGTHHLQQLAVKASLCLSNVLVREKLEFYASHDPLTGLYNRRRMEETIKSELIRQQRYSEPFSILFIDCNKFKIINDKYGHNCGDEVLKYIGEQLKNQLRGNDCAFRFAGDEFVITLVNQNAQQATNAANRLVSFFEHNPLNYNGKLIDVSISCGVAQSDGRQSVEHLLKRADQQLYRQKNINVMMN